MDLKPATSDQPTVAASRLPGRLSDGPPARGRTRSTALPILLVVGVAAACGGDGSQEAEALTPAPEERAVAVAAVEMVPRNLSRQIQVSGSIEPIREIRLASQMSGVVREVLMEEGDHVREGDILARFDVVEQEAELYRAQAMLEEAERAYERARELQELELVSASEFEASRAAFRTAQSEVRLWEARLGFGTVSAPSGGVITHKFVEAGDAVGNGEVLFHLADISALVVRVGISDVDAAQLSPGEPVEARVDALPGRLWDAEIRRIFPSADPDSRLVTVEIAFTDPDHSLLRPGFLARLRLDVDQRGNVMAVPNESLMASTAEDPFVFVINEENRLGRRSVVPGVSRRDWTEILEGLEEGERVVGSNPAVLSEGVLVQVADVIRHASDPD
jgi:membrane fusion protein, multidrug efflux system